MVAVQAAMSTVPSAGVRAGMMSPVSQVPANIATLQLLQAPKACTCGIKIITQGQAVMHEEQTHNCKHIILNAKVIKHWQASRGNLQSLPGLSAPTE